MATIPIRADTPAPAPAPALAPAPGSVVDQLASEAGGEVAEGGSMETELALRLHSTRAALAVLQTSELHSVEWELVDSLREALVDWGLSQRHIEEHPLRTDALLLFDLLSSFLKTPPTSPQSTAAADVVALVRIGEQLVAALSSPAPPSFKMRVDALFDQNDIPALHVILGNASDDEMRELELQKSIESALNNESLLVKLLPFASNQQIKDATAKAAASNYPLALRILLDISNDKAPLEYKTRISLVQSAVRNAHVQTARILIDLSPYGLLHDAVGLEHIVYVCYNNSFAEGAHTLEWLLSKSLSKIAGDKSAAITPLRDEYEIWNSANICFGLPRLRPERLSRKDALGLALARAAMKGNMRCIKVLLETPGVDPKWRRSVCVRLARSVSKRDDVVEILQGAITNTNRGKWFKNLRESAVTSVQTLRTNTLNAISRRSPGLHLPLLRLPAPPASAMRSTPASPRLSATSRSPHTQQQSPRAEPPTSPKLSIVVTPTPSKSTVIASPMRSSPESQDANSVIGAVTSRDSATKAQNPVILPSPTKSPSPSKRPTVAAPLPDSLRTSVPTPPPTIPEDHTPLPPQTPTRPSVSPHPYYEKPILPQHQRTSLMTTQSSAHSTFSTHRRMSDSMISTAPTPDLLRFQSGTPDSMRPIPVPQKTKKYSVAAINIPPPRLPGAPATLLSLPDTCLHLILHNLPSPQDLKNLTSTCTRLAQICTAPAFMASYLVYTLGAPHAMVTVVKGGNVEPADRAGLINAVWDVTKQRVDYLVRGLVLLQEWDILELLVKAGRIDAPIVLKYVDGRVGCDGARRVVSICGGAVGGGAFLEACKRVGGGCDEDGVFAVFVDALVGGGVRPSVRVLETLYMVVAREGRGKCMKVLVEDSRTWGHDEEGVKRCIVPAVLEAVKRGWVSVLKAVVEEGRVWLSVVKEVGGDVLLDTAARYSFDLSDTSAENLRRASEQPVVQIDGDGVIPHSAAMVELMLAGVAGGNSARFTAFETTHIKQGVDSHSFLLSAKPNDRDSPFHHIKDKVLLQAVWLGHEAVMDAVVTVTQPDLTASTLGQQLLLAACVRGHTKIVASLISGGVDFEGPDGEVCFAVAEDRGHADTVKYLKMMRDIRVKVAKEAEKKAQERAKVRRPTII